MVTLYPARSLVASASVMKNWYMLKTMNKRPENAETESIDVSLPRGFIILADVVQHHAQEVRCEHSRSFLDNKRLLACGRGTWTLTIQSTSLLHYQLLLTPMTWQRRMIKTCLLYVVRIRANIIQVLYLAAFELFWRTLNNGIIMHKIL